VNETMEREPADKLMLEAKTTSDKIRALGSGGYSRSEISKLLGIRYQHVRNVLLDAGITGGLKQEVVVPQPPVSIPLVETTKAVATSPDVLTQAGFFAIGHWALVAGGGIEFVGLAPVEPGVYAFVMENSVVYVGISNRGLRGRMRQYRRGDPRQRTSCRINGLIKAALADGRAVSALAAVPEESSWHGLPVSTASGLEIALIRQILPQWNIQIGKVRKSQI
jgi:hypothetical protein